MDVPPLINIGGTCPPCPIGIGAPAMLYKYHSYLLKKSSYSGHNTTLTITVLPDGELV